VVQRSHMQSRKQSRKQPGNEAAVWVQLPTTKGHRHGRWLHSPSQLPYNYPWQQPNELKKKKETTLHKILLVSFNPHINSYVLTYRSSRQSKLTLIDRVNHRNSTGQNSDTK